MYIYVYHCMGKVLKGCLEEQSEGDSTLHCLYSVI